MKKIFKLIVSIIVVSFLTAALSTSIGGLPSFGNLLNPYNGGYETARLSEKPDKVSLNSDFVSNQVTVFRDNFGVPHVFAETDEEMVYTLGYLHAQDRLFQMDMQRRLAEGKLAEVAGKSQLESDKTMRRIGLARSAERTIDNLKGTKFMDILEAYAAGVNKRIEEGKLPLGFKLLNYKPSKWTPTDTMAVAKLISWGLSGTLEPIQRQEAAEKLGENTYWNELFPEKTPYLVPIHNPPYSYAENQENQSENQNGTFEEGESAIFKSSTVSFFRSSYSKSGLGSNNWVVADENSEIGNPILASDPHLQLSYPSVWYQAYLSSDEGYNTMGVTLPGVPVILIGANESIAWGMTNINADDTDFYTYETKSDENKYLYDNEWRDFEEIKTTVKVKGSEDVEMTIRKTVHGPVVKPGDNPITMKWTGHESWTEVKAMGTINKADNLDEFMEGLKYWHCPPQNFAFADKHGNIALFSVGWYPLRKEGVSSVGVQNGSDPGNDWQGYISFEKIPHTINPEKGHLSSANQSPVTENYPYYLGRSWRPGYRGRRIDNLLSSKKSHNISDFKNYQRDIHSFAAQEMVPILLSVSKNKDFESLTNQALSLLSEWNYEMKENKVSPLLWTVWEMNLFRDVFDDEYEQANAEGLPLPRPIILEKLLKEEPNSKWFDDVSTNIRENREDIVLQSLGETMDLLSEEFGVNINDWKWGKVNKYDFEHLTDISALSKGPYPASGGRTTLNVAPASPPHPDLQKMLENDNLQFEVKHGPSWRMVVSPGVKYYGVYPGGQSENPLSEHYDDKLKQYLDWDYDEVTLPENPQSMSENLVESKLFIEPNG